MLSVIVKGTRFEAARAAADRGIPAVFADEWQEGTRAETVLHVGDQFTDKVARWFCEQGSAPYPAGACLLYSTVKDGAVKVLADRCDCQRGPSPANVSRIVEARCTRHGVVASGEYWTPVAVRGSLHANPGGDCAASVRIEWVMDYADWQAIHPDYRSWTDTERRALHRDQYGDTLLVPVRIRCARGAA